MIHPTASVDPRASIEHGVVIGAFCRIEGGVHLEANTTLEPHVTIVGDVHVGQGSHIYAFAVIGSNSCPITIGRNVTIREFCRIGTQEGERDAIRIKPSVFVMAHSEIHGGVTVGEKSIVTNATVFQSHSRSEEQAIIGGGALIGPGCVVGTGAMIGGGSHVQCSIPPFCLAEGTPAKVVSLNVIGLRRRFSNKETIAAIKKTFKELYRHGFDKGFSESLAGYTNNKEAVHLIDFTTRNMCALEDHNDEN